MSSAAPVSAPAPSLPPASSPHTISPLLQKLAVLKDGFQLDSSSQQELWGSSPSLASSDISAPRLYSDAGSQTDIPAEVSPGGGLQSWHTGLLPCLRKFVGLFQFMSSSNKLAEKVRLSLKYEEAKRRWVQLLLSVPSRCFPRWCDSNQRH